MTHTYSPYGFGRRPAFQFGRAASREDRLARIDALATVLDTAFIVPGTNVRFGFDALIGLVPGIGDVVTTVMSLYIVHEARQLGVPRYLLFACWPMWPSTGWWVRYPSLAMHST